MLAVQWTLNHLTFNLLLLISVKRLLGLLRFQTPSTYVESSDEDKFLTEKNPTPTKVPMFFQSAIVQKFSFNLLLNENCLLVQLMLSYRTMTVDLN